MMNRGLTLMRRNRGLVTRPERAERPVNSIITRDAPLPLSVPAARTITLNGRQERLDPHALIGMIRRVTQAIGEHRETNDVYSATIIKALRSARGDFVRTLQSEFNIHWRINAETGVSEFFI